MQYIPTAFILIAVITLLCVVGCNRGNNDKEDTAREISEIQHLYDQLYANKHTISELQQAYIDSVYAARPRNSSDTSKTRAVSRLLNTIREYQIKNDTLASQISKALSEYEKHRNEITASKFDRMDSHFSMWVAILSGIATIVAVSLTLQQININRKVEDDLECRVKEVKEAVKNSDRAVRRSNVHSHCLEMIQMLITLNTIMNFENKDAIRQQGKTMVMYLLDGVIMRLGSIDESNIVSDIPNADEASGAAQSVKTSPGYLYLDILQQINCFVCTYEPYIRLPKNRRKTMDIKEEIKSMSYGIIDNSINAHRGYKGQICSLLQRFKEILDASLPDPNDKKVDPKAVNMDN